MSYDYESTLQLFLNLKSDDDEDDFESELVDVPLVKGISWRLRPYITHNKNDSRLYLYVLVGNEELTQKLSYSIRIDIKPTIFSKTSEFFAADKVTNSRDISGGFQMTGIGNYNFQKVLKDNKFVVDIRAKLTIRSSRDLLAPTKFFKDISNPNLADFTIQIGNETWKAHKLILSARSPVFCRMLANKECEESKKSLLKLVDVTKDTFEIFFRYLYTERVPNLSLKQAMDVLMVANKYDVQELKNICDETLVKLVQCDHPVHDIFQFAHVYNCSKKLKEKAFGYLKSSFHGKVLRPELIEKPDLVKRLVDKMNEFDETLKEVNEAARPDTAKLEEDLEEDSEEHSEED